MPSSPPNKTNRVLKLKILLCIDTVFLFLELFVGAAVGSLALIADAFHMLNDVCSLIVALQALKLAEESSTSARYSYGWQRAEVLGALINGVFLLALCFSIGLEAITRFFNYVEVTNPKLIVAVGSAGLASNIIGLFLFHDHGHSHGGHSHGHSHSHGDEEAAKPATKHVHAHAPATDRTPLLSQSTSSQTPTIIPSSATTIPMSRTSSSSSSERDPQELAEEELFVHPGEFRENIVKAAHEAGYGSQGATHSRHRTLSVSGMKFGHGEDAEVSHAGHDHGAHAGHAHGEEGHSHDEAPHHGHGGHGHDGAMNMRGVFLHVLGDALGNVGVIGAGLFIWLNDYSWRMYSDPIISLVITCIIFSSALPLVKSASFILLQGVPSSVPLDQVRAAIAAVPGVLNVHELHIWSLSESKAVASVHIMTNGKDFVEVSKTIRRVMHRFGIHSSTIQPEIVENKASAAPSHVTSADAADIDLEQDGCLIQCVDDSCAENSCCPPSNSDAK